MKRKKAQWPTWLFAACVLALMAVVWKITVAAPAPVNTRPESREVDAHSYRDSATGLWCTRFEIGDYKALDLNVDLRIESVTLIPDAEQPFLEFWTRDSFPFLLDYMKDFHYAYTKPAGNPELTTLTGVAVRLGFRTLERLGINGSPMFAGDSVRYPIRALQPLRGEVLALTYPVEAYLDMEVDVERLELNCPMMAALRGFEDLYWAEQQDSMRRYQERMGTVFGAQRPDGTEALRGRAKVLTAAMKFGAHDLRRVEATHVVADVFPNTNLHAGTPKTLSLMHKPGPLARKGQVTYSGRPAIREHMDEHYLQAVEVVRVAN